ncbi:alpha/beta hydrolase [Lederbergia lenta]|uniref:Alpha/beta hydrolase fold protein n=1 Tax=Lederbergia lenta TaxID=1467 RepID=A0A2X4W9D7_LEDLE|nr:alpha/beta hydrolase [Lederbergia lenta]MCM3113420.1 alpha/beta hydrolase [Lederbergia lenta]MEC2326435.1 alpha/beta hydrolase [Lederbergia lenta]SQI61267.1 alpha/beta hydrolase fold protein [Lederbergia lenta]
MRKWEAIGTAKAVIVIVHGAMEHQGRYGWLIEMWRLNGFHVIVGDLPGQGLTTRSHRGHIRSFDEYIEETKLWLQEANTYALPIFMLGHSMGGLTVIRLLQTVKIHVDGIILSSPCLGLVEYPPTPINALSVGLNWIAPGLKINSNLSIDLVTRNEEEKMRAMNDSLYVTKVSVRWYRELLKAMKTAFMQISDFPDIPLLVMQGGDDKIVSKSDVRKWFNELAISEKTYKEWPKCYHEIFNEPEREIIFNYAKSFAELRLRMLGYVSTRE